MTELNDQAQQQQTPEKKDLTYWNSQWCNNKIGFHRLTVNPDFEKYVLSKIISVEQQQSILFPLSGKTVDMKAALDSKHQVIGIECAQLGIESFFQENNIKYNIENNECQVYKGIDYPVTIFHDNFLTFNQTLPTIDWIWDRAALVAVNLSDREQYRDNLLRLMTPGHTRLYLVAVCYDDPELTGPPHSVSDEDVISLFGSTCSIELISVNDTTADFIANSHRNVRLMEEHLHLIIRK
ncbi:unnamed protein product [Rotaria magnacalcarata]|uniref:thiopurine S-methyltransferase n=1 Tax=Rotaria magnacalcarata TaxID=392030 RepID=A0A819WZS4_9BILA|nr:unnamed protein product [Rotaria magnacalcarata]CAF1428520.1 unnamed protein product [Rotaria magnacalcarata]CAF1929815.1 unnamed protein product [Rotaria magnacalcarata]CAF1965227.1 unnamed protein product [Rotaria magnacalcarata]CAF4132173.1 unnamed protein product [Rotaria magnacalcarata]